MMKKPKILVLGLDGVGPDLLRRFADRGILPNFSALMAEGTHGPLFSTRPPTTFPAWTSFMTGTFPSSHGIPDFTLRTGYRIRFASACDRKAPTWFHYFEQMGLTVGTAWFPATYPPEKLNGFQISGWDSPVTSQGDSSFVQPAKLHMELIRNFGNDHLAFDSIDEFKDSDDWYDKAAEALPRRIERRAEMAQWLIENRPTDVAAFYFGEADTAAHHFWGICDPNSPRRPPNVDPHLAQTLERVYIALDSAAGALIRAVGPQAAVVVLSDHGSGGSSDIGIYLNRMLNHAGLLSFKRELGLRFDSTAWRNRLPAAVPAWLRRPLFRLGGGIAPSLMESSLRFGGIDFRRTLAFSEELPYGPSIWFNQLGREPNGLMRPEEKNEITRAIEQAASSLRSPDGEVLVRRIVPRDTVHLGRFKHLFPDLLIEFESPNGYTPVCLASRGRAADAVVRLSRAELSGRKGRSMPGCHTDKGVFVVKGASIPANLVASAGIEDVAMMIAALAGVPKAPWFEGSCPGWLPDVKDAVAKVAPPLNGPVPSAYTENEERVVASRLQRLGYLEE